MNILLIEDDIMLGQALVDTLKAHSFNIFWCQHGEQGISMVAKKAWNLIILDLGLPKVSGTEVLSKLRKKKVITPILILTARDGTADKVTHLNMGADDYLVKPFELDELIARIHVLTRRSFGHIDSIIKYNEITINLTSHTVFFKNKEVVLPKMEYIILKELLLNRGRVLSREKLEQNYESGKTIGSNAVEVHIHHLRSKFYPSLVKNIRGVGYIVEKDSKACP